MIILTKVDEKMLKNITQNMTYLAENDPPAFSLLLGNINVLKARCEYGKVQGNMEQQSETMAEEETDEKDR